MIRAAFLKFLDLRALYTLKNGKFPKLLCGFYLPIFTILEKNVILEIKI